MLSVGIIEELTFNKKCYINNITFPLGYISAIRAGQGTGKTFQALRFANAQKSVLAISHRVSLVKGLQEKANEGMEGKWAVYDKLGGTEMNDKNHLISTLHSAHKFAHSRTKLKPYDVVLLDEIIQQLKELTGSIEYKQAILEVLRFFLSNAKHIILMDADLNSESIRFIQSLAGGKPVKCFLYPPTNRYQSKHYTDK
ncbi:hypothetical protein, partial [Candidatus Venteria ishoeyi]|uniref:hypothetical protein n=1 Tax=Candidatus Venteria ishoeyi TaxID=1899563 RepID=UPI0011B028D3